MTEPVKETKAQKVERLKRALNPWEARAEIERFAREGHGAIPPEWGTYFRWWGVYSQGDGVGAVGGKGGEGKAVPYFMVRIRIPNGFLRSRHLRTIAELAERHARGVADLTVRQNIQLHWVRSVLRRGELQVAVATGGASPALSRVIREKLEGYLTDDYAALSRLAAEVRRELGARRHRVGAEAWRRALGADLRQLLAEGRHDEARARLLERLGVPACR
jgi:sulfite reductase (ferredoxin)